MTELLPRVELDPARGRARAAVIWLHGLGADGHDFEPIVPELDLDDLAIRFVFPHAPTMPVTINDGMRMPAWYDILAMELERKVDESGVLASAAQLEALVTHERERGIPDERIVLAGFSQGGAIAVHVALRHTERLAGCLALSTYMVRSAAIEGERSEANRDLPFFQAHGTLDPMVPLAAGQAAYQRLTGLGYSVEWHTYPMQHQVCAEEIRDAARWLRGVLS